MLRDKESGRREKHPWDYCSEVAKYFPSRLQLSGQIGAAQTDKKDLEEEKKNFPKITAVKKQSTSYQSLKLSVQLGFVRTGQTNWTEERNITAVKYQGLKESVRLGAVRTGEKDWVEKTNYPGTSAVG